MSDVLTRRLFLTRSGALTAGTLLAPAALRAQEQGRLRPTESNIEGPFYRADAPFREKLAEGVEGKALIISGRVLTTDGSPLSEAVVDVWHADTGGAYDNESDKFLLRGRIRTGKDGLYRYETILPGQYDLGESKRPAHIHYKVSGEKHRTLTTQLYFAGDEFLARDPWARTSLTIPLTPGEKEGDPQTGLFDIVLVRAT